MNRLRDPYTSSMLVIAAIAVAGFAAIVLGALGAADQTSLDAQLPFVVSGGIGGFALVVIAAGLYATQRRRMAAAERRERLDAVLRAAVEASR